MADGFCGKCGTKVKDVNFCTTCGNKIKNTEKTEEKTHNLMEYLSSKGSERAGFFKRKGQDEQQQSQQSRKKKFASLSSKKSRVQEIVTINVGIISDSNGQLGILRGSKLPVQVSRNCDSSQVLLAAVKKHSDHDQFFCPLESYVLLYPDQKQVISIPGSSNLFTLESYKKELAKPYSKIDLYLCLSSTFHCENYNKEIDNFKLDLDISIKEPNDHSDFQSSVHVNQNTYSLPANDTNISPQPIETQDEKLWLDLPMPYNDIGNMFDEMVSNENQFKSTTESKLLCPICNRKFPVSLIEGHANDCLSKSQKNCIVVYDSTDECEPEEESHTSKNTMSDCSVTEEDINKQITLALQTLDVEKDKEHKIHVRRGQCFEDFTSFFKKKWNKPGCCYKITFIGEAGIDTGGLSREFYSGIYRHVIHFLLFSNELQR